MQRMITQFHNSIHSAYPFYYYIGSAPLWRQHIEMLIRMKETLKQVRINEDNSKSNFDHLPIEMQCEVIRRLDNGKDILNVGMINSNLYRVTQELLIWRQLCLYHFSDNSKHSVLGEKILGFIKRQQKDADMDNIDWKKVYFRLKRRYGLREVYAEMIHQCQLCKSLFWQVCFFFSLEILFYFFKLGF
jgi:F-box protein 25/32